MSLVGLSLLFLACSKPETDLAPPRDAASANVEAGIPLGAATASPSGAPPPLSHLASKPPPNAKRTCPKVAGGEQKATQLATVIRQLACDPSLYFQPVEEVRRRLNIPDDMELTFNGPASVSIELRDAAPSAQSLANAIGIGKPMVAMANQGAWRSKNWFLGSNADSGALDIWGPGIARIGVRVDTTALGSNIEVAPLAADSELRGYVVVRMPDDVVPIKHDDLGVTQLIAGLGKLSEDKRLLVGEPELAARRAGLEGERFRLSRRSIGDTQVAIDVWTARTQIDAAPLLKALGLEGEIEHRRARDADDYVLSGGGSDGGHTWRGLSLGLSFDRRQGATGADHKDYVLAGITVQ